MLVREREGCARLVYVCVCALGEGGLLAPHLGCAGYLIPNAIVTHFLRDVDKFGRNVGFPSLGLTTQHLDNPQLRAYLRMPPKATGVLVIRVFPCGSCRDLVRPDDVLMSVEGRDISCDGTIQVGMWVGCGCVVWCVRCGAVCGHEASLSRKRHAPAASQQGRAPESVVCGAVEAGR
jgi:hypothetical protein